MSEIVKINVKHRYPWEDLQLGDTFTIPSENEGGVKYHHQLVYAANKSFSKRGLTNCFRSIKQEDGSVVVTRII